MLRARLATLTLAGGLVLSSAGCLNLSERFHCWRANAGSRGARSATSAMPECPCEDGGIPYGAAPYGAVPTGLEGGPALVTPDAAPPIMTAPPGAVAPAPPPPGQPTVPMGPPPRIVPIPATAVPWQGQ